MLSTKEKECAEMYAMGCIGIQTVESILNCDVCDLTQEWHQYAKEYSEGYNKYLKRQKRIEDALSSFNSFISSRYGIEAIASFGRGFTVDVAIDALHYAYNSMCDNHMQYEISVGMAYHGEAFMHACREWDLI